MILIKNADLYSPHSKGITDILIEGDKIAEIGKNINVSGVKNLTVIDLNNKIVTPGIIDIHSHIIGGGGEMGPSSMIRESYLSDFTKAGITTVVGLLGTDGIIRTVESLLVKAKALNSEGLTVKILTGSYRVPSDSISSDIERDIILFEEIIGTKIALSDHRDSHPSKEELIRVFERSRRGGLLSGKAGIVTIHMGNGKRGLKDVLEILNNTEIPIKNIIPTHIASRSDLLIDHALEFMKMGGTVDISAASNAEENKIVIDRIKQLNKNFGYDQITISSDAFGSMPKFDESRNIVGYSFAKPEFILNLMKQMIQNGFKIEDVLKMTSKNPARVIGLEKSKGRIEENFDADLIVFDEKMDIDTVISKGKIMIRDKNVLEKGMTEQ